MSETDTVDAGQGSWAERSRNRIGSWVDGLALRAMSLAFDWTLVPPASEDGDVRAAAAPYLGTELADRPASFFDFLGRIDGRRSAVRPVRTRRIPGGSLLEADLASEYEPFHRPAEDDCAENATIPLAYWEHRAPAPATLIALHGFTMGNLRTDAAVLMLGAWYAHGLDVVQMVLPYHGERRPPEARYSGERFASWHVGRLNEAVRQSVNDVARVIAWRRHVAPATPIGIVGVSLGGYVAALLAELDAALAFVMPIAPTVHLGVFPSTLFARSRFGSVMPPPLTLDEMRNAYRPHCPLTHPLAVARERVLLVAGRGDRVAPPEHVVALWEHWERPAIHWYDGSHTVPFHRRGILAAGVAHLRRIGVLGA